MDTLVHHVVKDCQVDELVRHVVELTVHLSLNIMGRAVEKDMAKVFSQRFK
jgi:hypothetical protein